MSEHPDDRNVSYRLVDVLASGGLWAQRANTSLFASHGTFAGDGPGRGALATDPAGLSANYFRIPETLDRVYVNSPY